MTVPLAFSEVGEGPPLVILHGLFGSARNWRTIAERLADRYHVYAVDLRNHGESGHADTMTFSEMIDDLREFLDARGLDRPAILGHSVGGKIAMLFALLYGQHLDRVVVVDIAPFAYAHTYLPEVRAMRGIDAATVESRADAETRLAKAIFDAPLRTFLLQNLVSRDGGYAWRINLDAIADAMEQLTGFPDVTGLEYDGPSLFVSGDGSDYVRAGYHAKIRTLFPAAKFTVIPGAGHRVHAEQPEKFLASVREFLAER
jgi:pimeloyl-ACP methyl ester carboxylesterase